MSTTSATGEKLLPQVVPKPSKILGGVKTPPLDAPKRGAAAAPPTTPPVPRWSKAASSRMKGRGTGLDSGGRTPSRLPARQTIRERFGIGNASSAADSDSHRSVFRKIPCCSSCPAGSATSVLSAGGGAGDSITSEESPSVEELMLAWRVASGSGSPLSGSLGHSAARFALSRARPDPSALLGVVVVSVPVRCSSCRWPRS
mmetsp:Transcript_19623/g.49312  ORF Transcript_19623/g.49312 Transcript_19623/m.49312 type:complete len:201 (+) Transcript_19623:941-1543(+)